MGAEISSPEKLGKVCIQSTCKHKCDRCDRHHCLRKQKCPIIKATILRNCGKNGIKMVVRFLEPNTRYKVCIIARDPNCCSLKAALFVKMKSQLIRGHDYYDKDPTKKCLIFETGCDTTRAIIGIRAFRPQKSKCLFINQRSIRVIPVSPP